MASLLRMPEIAANVVEAVLNEWPLQENASFAAGDPIATVETEKAVVDVPAEADGVLLRTLVEPGKSVTVGTPMAVLAAPGEVVDDLDALIRRLTGAEPPPIADVSPAGARPARVFASPLARRIAKENGLYVADIHATGPGGRIVRDDVRRAMSEQGLADRKSAASSQAPPPGRTATPEPAPAAVLTATPGPGPEAVRTPTSEPIPESVRTTAPEPIPEAVRTAAPEPNPESVRTAAPQPIPEAVRTAARGAGYDDVPHSRMRRAIANRLAESSRAAPVFTIRGSARVDALLGLRKELNEAAGVKISVNDLIVAAAARAHVALPDMNVIWTPDAVRRFHDVDISIAVATQTGLVTPVVRGVQSLTVSALAGRSAELVARARDGRLRQDEIEGGTLTVTNLGVFGTEDFSAVINPPQAAILAVGAARQEAVVTDGELGVATVLRVTLSVDHRPVDGALAARWMAHFLGLIEAPLRILV